MQMHMLSLKTFLQSSEKLKSPQYLKKKRLKCYLKNNDNLPTNRPSDPAGGQQPPSYNWQVKSSHPKVFKTEVHQEISLLVPQSTIQVSTAVLNPLMLSSLPLMQNDLKMTSWCKHDLNRTSTDLKRTSTWPQIPCIPNLYTHFTSMTSTFPILD